MFFMFDTQLYLSLGLKQRDRAVKNNHFPFKWPAAENKNRPLSQQLFKPTLPGMQTVTSSYLMDTQQLAFFVVFPALPTVQGHKHISTCPGPHMSTCKNSSYVLTNTCQLAVSNKQCGDRGSNIPLMSTLFHSWALCLHHLLFGTGNYTALFCLLGYSGTQY